MYRSVVAPVDGSAFGEQALPHAAAVARRNGAVLHVVHAHVPLVAPSGVEAVAFGGAWEEAAKREERAYLAELAERVEAACAVRVTAALLDGAVAPAVAEYALRQRAGLVVMSTHAHGRLSRLWHPGVCAEVAAALPVPVLLVRPPRGDVRPELERAPRFEHLLVALDGSVHAERMVEHALAFAHGPGARLTLLRVVRPARSVAHAALSRGARWDAQQLDRDRATARAYLERVAARARSGTRRVEVATCVAEDPARGILDFARAAASSLAGRVDVVALECHPHRPMARVLGAHTADRVLRDAPVPVLLFEPRPHAEARAGAPALVAEAN